MVDFCYGLVIGILSGYLLREVMYKFKPIFGILKIDRTNPDKDIYSIEIKIPLDNLKNNDEIILKVDDTRK